MDKINFQDGTKTSSAKVTIDEVDYPVTPARYSGATPLSALVLNTMQDNIEDAIDQNVSNIGGEEYDETATYEEGDIVKYEGQLYICIEAIDTPEEWDSTKWNATDVLSSAGGNEVTIGTSADITGKTKIFIDESEGTDAYSEVVNSLAGDEIAKAPSVHAVNQMLKGTVLYNNANGDNGNITLSDSASNYDYLEIYVGGGSVGDRMVCHKMDLSLSLIANIFNISADGGGAIYFQCRPIKVVSNKIQTLDSNRYSAGNINTSGGVSFSHTNSIYIYKVIGYKGV